ncbi:sulfotransferase 1C2A-like [Ptychodera flava]|uniref:sulfotransferase 1C2A-like n=1 Tax=Ptychodera flava TaxID=63121 RepID=UPI00396A96E4
MKKDLKGKVRMIADFLGKKLSDESTSEIAEECTFQSMKKSIQKAILTVFKTDSVQNPFVRQGKTSGWKEYFTVAQNENFDQTVYPGWIRDSGLKVEFK